MGDAFGGWGCQLPGDDLLIWLVFVLVMRADALERAMPDGAVLMRVRRGDLAWVETMTRIMRWTLAA
jgi:hypothetical protein